MPDVCASMCLRGRARWLAVRPCFTLPVMRLYWPYFYGSTETGREGAPRTGFLLLDLQIYPRVGCGFVEVQSARQI